MTLGSTSSTGSLHLHTSGAYLAEVEDKTWSRPTLTKDAVLLTQLSKHTKRNHLAILVTVRAGVSSALMGGLTCFVYSV